MVGPTGSNFESLPVHTRQKPEFIISFLARCRGRRYKLDSGFIIGVCFASTDPVLGAPDFCMLDPLTPT